MQRLIIYSIILFQLILPAYAAEKAEVDATAPHTLGAIADNKRVEYELRRIIQTYESGDISAFRALLDPSLIGYQNMLESFARDHNALKQIRVTLKDVRALAGTELGMVEASWEKRFFSAINYQPGIVSGKSGFLLHRVKDEWKLAGIVGDNLFASEGGGAASIDFTGFNPAGLPACTLTSCVTPPPVCTDANNTPCASGSPGCTCVVQPTVCNTTTTLTPGPGVTCPAGSLNGNLVIVEPDYVGQQSLTAEILTSRGDRERVTLQAASPGRFVLANIPAGRLASLTPTPGNGVLEIGAGDQLAVRYVDQRPGRNRPPSVLTRALSIQ